MGEDHGLIEMKIINYVGVGEGLQLDQFIDATPAMAGGDDGMLRGARAHGGEQLFLHGGPALERHFPGRFVHDLQENLLGVTARKMPRQCAPKGNGLRDELVVVAEPILGLFAGMPVDNDRQSGTEQLVERKRRQYPLT